MKTILSILILISPFSGILSQVADVISGATIKKEQMDQYLADRAIRAIYNNNPFDNQPLTHLAGNMPFVNGEILNPGMTDTSAITPREVVVKELLPGNNGLDPVFKGAFCYTGYPLSDLISDFVVNKSNRDEFGLPHDLYVVVSNESGNYTVFSWGELFNSKRGKDIILATGVRPVFPTNSDDRWDIPETMKIVSANDYLTVRNIDNPKNIMIVSSPDSFNGSKGDVLYSPDLVIKYRGETINLSRSVEETAQNLTLRTVFFGLHMGFRRLSSFSGFSLSETLYTKLDFGETEYRTGIITIGSGDGYRVLYSLSEILNRADTEEILLIDEKDNQDGRFMIFPTSDFFADRFLKGASIGYIRCVEK